MKFKITPLNIGTAFLIFLAGYVWIYGASKVSGGLYLNLSGTISLIFLLFAFVTFVLDLMLRNFFPETKKLWIIETCFVVLVVVLLLLVKK
jgi:hypothetical protein